MDFLPASSAKKTESVRLLIQAVVGTVAVLMGIWVELPWPDLIALGLVVGMPPVVTLSKILGGDGAKWALPCEWAGSITLAGSLFLTTDKVYWCDSYYGIQAWCLAVCIGLTPVAEVAQKSRWLRLGLVWAFFGAGIWLAAGYLQNQLSSFILGLLAGILLLILVRAWFRLPPTAIVSVNSLILLGITLPLANLFIKPLAHSDRPVTAGRNYSLEFARKDPAQFARWWGQYLEEWTKMGNAIFVADPRGILPFRLRPCSSARLFDSRIFINSRGFRGSEFSLEKGDAYRIVAMGESTTFGCTLQAKDQPWPELLEQMIRERLKPKRRVEVINAGIPAYNIRHNLNRLTKEILPLKPDMIISYHGYNGFNLLDKSLSLAQGRHLPVYKQRPVHLLANVEYRLKIAHYRWRDTLNTVMHPPTFANPMETEYARAYRELITATRRNGIRLALANFSMAVNSRSDRETVDFYRPGFPYVRWQITANGIHTMILKGLAQHHPEVCAVNTQPGLDGCDEKFIDLVHLTQPGRQKLAENIYAGIKNVLETDLH